MVQNTECEIMESAYQLYIIEKYELTKKNKYERIIQILYCL